MFFIYPLVLSKVGIGGHCNFARTSQFLESDVLGAFVVVSRRPDTVAHYYDGQLLTKAQNLALTLRGLPVGILQQAPVLDLDKYHSHCALEG